MAQTRKPPVPQAGSGWFLLVKRGINLLDDELCDRARRVEFTGIARGLEIFEDLLVDVAEHVAVVGGLKSMPLILLMTWRMRVPDFM